MPVAANIVPCTEGREGGGKFACIAEFYLTSWVVQQKPSRANPAREEVRLLRTRGESLAEISEWHTKTTREEAVGA